MDTALADGRANFDFEIGRWQVRRRRLKQLLQTSPDWDEFTGVAHSTRLNPSMGDTSVHASSGLLFLQPRADCRGAWESNWIQDHTGLLK